MNLNIGYNIIWHSKHTVDRTRSRMANKQPAQTTADPEKQEVWGAFVEEVADCLIGILNLTQDISEKM